MAKNVVIIGGGASGLMAAIWASRLGAAVTVLEKNDKPGRKLLATGNGRCNFTNRYQDASCYRTGNQERASRVLEQFTEQDTEQFFEQLGIRIRSREGWLYPASEQAQSVLDLLVLEARFRKVKIKTRETAVAVEKAENGYLVRTEGWQYPADSVIICCGSCASQIAGSDGDTLRFADQLQLASIPFSPALCPLRCKGNQFSSWAGVRVRAKITLLVENQEILTEQGELQLTDYGVSGIPVFQISRFAVRACMQKKRAELLVDFFPELTESELTAEFVRRQEICPYKAPKELLIGLLPEKLIPVLIGKKKIPEEMAGAIKSYRLQITGQTDFGKAQVCAGGITLDPEQRVAVKNGEIVELTAKEYDLIELLVKNPRRVYSRENLMDLVWGYTYAGDYRTVDVHIRRLREKLEENPAAPQHILTKWGVGYYLKD